MRSAGCCEAAMTIRSRAMAVDAVLFDLDGTLLDTAPEITEAINLTLQELGLPQLTEVQVTRMIGRGSPILIERVLRAVGDADAESRPRALALYEDYYEQRVGSRTALYPGVAR